MRDGTLGIWHDDIGWFAGEIAIGVRTPAVAALDLSGGSDADVRGTHAGSFAIRASGGSDAELSASATLDVEASGGSDVSYRGEPQLTRDVSGSSDLTQG